MSTSFPHSGKELAAYTPHQELGLTDAEYEGICECLEREPNALELAVFSLMWSEHCAYKHSKKLLRILPTEGPHILMGPGENAGVVDVGDGLAAGQGPVPRALALLASHGTQARTSADDRFLARDAEAYLQMGFTQFTLGFEGPRWDVDAGRTFLAWRDELNQARRPAAVGA